MYYSFLKLSSKYLSMSKCIDRKAVTSKTNICDHYETHKFSTYFNK